MLKYFLRDISSNLASSAGLEQFIGRRDRLRSNSHGVADALQRCFDTGRALNIRLKAVK